MYYYFGHFASRLVKAGDSLKEGQPIGIIGMTGNATGVHTHHEVRKTQGGNQVDPETYYKEEPVGEIKKYRDAWQTELKKRQAAEKQVKKYRDAWQTEVKRRQQCEALNKK